MAAAERSDRSPEVVAPDVAALETVVRPRLAVDLRLTLGPPAAGSSVPTGRRDPDGSWWRATRTPDGPATVRFAPAGPGEIRVQAWGPGAAWAVEAAPDLIGARDSLDGFDPPPGLVRELHHRMPGLRIARSRAVFEALVPTVLAQKVTGAEASRGYRGLVRLLGEPAPGPGCLVMPPSPEAVAGLPYHRFHPLGVEMRRANVLRFAARGAARLEEATVLPLLEARRRLTAFPGVGPWTAAEVALIALGDADAVSFGDYHIPNTVAWALAGEPRGTDERLLELLAPFAGHRGRVIRLLEAAGIGAPRFGPRLAVRSIAKL